MVILFLVSKIVKIFMQEARAAGCHSSAEADKYNQEKRKKEAEESGWRKENAQAGLTMPVSSDSVSAYSNSRTTQLDDSSSLTDFDLMSFPVANLLSESVSMHFLVSL